MKASFSYTYNMPLDKFKVIEVECLALFNQLANKEEKLTENEIEDLKSFQDNTVPYSRLPIPHTILELESVIFIRYMGKTLDLDKNQWMFKENPFKLIK